MSLTLQYVWMPIGTAVSTNDVEETGILIVLWAITLFEDETGTSRRGLLKAIQCVGEIVFFEQRERVLLIEFDPQADCSR